MSGKSIWSGLARSRKRLAEGLGRAFSRGPSGFEAGLVEEALLTADMGWEFTEEVLARLERMRGSPPGDSWREALRQSMTGLLDIPDWEGPGTPSVSPGVVLFVGVNGSGKTTTIAKLANLLLRSGDSVMLSCADTYRAAAAEQLQQWGGRLGIETVTQLPGSDPAAVAFDSISRARSRRTDWVLVDTAGRLPNRLDLMAELSKIHKVCSSALGHPPSETLMVFDGSVGQNALAQAGSFTGALPVTGLIVTKLDGTARGGAVVVLAHTLGLPIRFIGTGEALDDIEPFHLEAYLDALLGTGGEG